MLLVMSVSPRICIQTFYYVTLPHVLHLCVYFSFCLSDSNVKIMKNNFTENVCTAYHFQSVGHRAFQYLFETVMGCLVPFSLITSCYSSVMCRLQSAKFQRRGKGSRLILIIVCAFAVFWLPYHIVNLIEVIVMIVLRHNLLLTDETIFTSSFKQILTCCMSSLLRWLVF